jgi:hypothetical protein
MLADAVLCFHALGAADMYPSKTDPLFISSSDTDYCESYKPTAN